MISSRQIFSCTVLPVSSVFVSVVCAFSLCSKAWSIFQENVIPVPGLFTRSRLHQRSETRSPQCSCYESARVHARQHSGDIQYMLHTAGSTNRSLLTLQITHLPGLAAPPGSCSRDSLTHKFRLRAIVLLVTSQQRSGLSDGSVLPQSMPPAALTRPDWPPANNRVRSAACRRSLPLSFTSQDVSAESCVEKIYMSSPTLQRTVPLLPKTTESLMFSTLALLWWYRGSCLMICISLSG